MKEIDKYLKSLYKHLNANDKEIADLKEETRSHLLDSVKELQSEGKSPQESVETAITRFGEADQIGRELPKVLMISRRRFSRLMLSITGIALALIIIFSFIIADNVNKEKSLQRVDIIAQEFMQELYEAQNNSMDYTQAFNKIYELYKIYSNNSILFTKELDTKYNVSAIDQILEMNNIFNYHNGLLMSIAIIAANTDYECPYFIEIAQISVMKLTNSKAVIDLAEKARLAKTDEDFELIEDEIRNLKNVAELKSYQDALNYSEQKSK